VKKYGLFAIAAFTSLLASHVRAETLNLLIWEDYISKQVIDDWTKKTGVTINQIYFDSGDKRDEILSDPTNNIDLAIVAQASAAIYGDHGVLEPIDDKTVPGLPAYPALWRDRCGKYALPYFWGTMGILWRNDVIHTAPTSWADLMQPAPALKGHIAMITDYSDFFVAPLKFLGKSINAGDTATIKQAFAVSKAQAPSVLTYTYAITSIQDPQKGPQIDMALGYSGDQLTLNNLAGKGNHWQFALPKEGTMLWLDCIAAIHKSAQRKLALEFIAYLASPEAAARNSIDLNLPTANTAAAKLLPAAMQTEIAKVAPEAIIAKSEFATVLPSEAIQMRKRVLNTLVNFHVAQ
jgi:spermidine/putrescine transport system substrate-binding protein